MNRDRANETQVVIGVLADEIHATRRPVDMRRSRTAERFSKCFFYDVCFDNQSITPAKTPIVRPAYKFTLTVVRGAALEEKITVPEPVAAEQHSSTFRRVVAAIVVLAGAAGLHPDLLHRRPQTPAPDPPPREVGAARPRS